MKTGKTKNKKEKRKNCRKKKEKALESNIKYKEPKENKIETNQNLSYLDYIEKNINPYIIVFIDVSVIIIGKRKTTI